MLGVAWDFGYDKDIKLPYPTLPDPTLPYLTLSVFCSWGGSGFVVHSLLAKNGYTIKYQKELNL